MLEKDMGHRNIDLVLYATINGDGIHELDNSIRLHQENYYFLMPPRRPFANKNYVVNLYETTLLCVIAVSVTTWCFVWKFLTRQSIAGSIFDTYQLAVQLMVHKSPSTSRARIFFMSLLIYFMCLNIAYQTRLSSVLTSPRYTPQIKTIRQLLFHSDVRVIRAFNNTLRTLYAIDEVQEALREKWIPFPSRLRTIDLIEHFIRNQSEAISLSHAHLRFFKNLQKLHVMYFEPVSTIQDVKWRSSDG